MAGPLASTRAGGRSICCRGAGFAFGSLRSGTSPTSTFPWPLDEEDESGAGGCCCARAAAGKRERAIALETSPANRRGMKIRCENRDNIDMMETKVKSMQQAGKGQTG